MTGHARSAAAGHLDESLTVLQEAGRILVTPEPGTPGFADADPDGKVLAVALGYAGRHIGPILDALAAQPQESLKDRLEALGRSAPAMFAELRDVLVCSYLSTPTVWRLLGYGGRVARPPAEGEAEVYLSGGVLDAVIARGPVYRLPENDTNQAPATDGRRWPTDGAPTA